MSILDSETVTPARFIDRAVSTSPPKVRTVSGEIDEYQVRIHAAIDQAIQQCDAIAVLVEVLHPIGGGRNSQLTLRVIQDLANTN